MATMGFMDLPKAPADITPAKFFTEWLPTQMKSNRDLISSFSGGVSAAISARITGAGGGEWTAVLANGEVKIEPGLRKDAVVTMVMESGNFVAMATGQMDDVVKPLPSVAELTPEQAVAKAKQNLEAMKSIVGSAKFVIDDKDKPFWAMAKFGGELKDEADVTVTMDRETALAVASGETNPQAAFMAGRVQITGDLSILMQLTPILM